MLHIFNRSGKQLRKGLSASASRQQSMDENKHRAGASSSSGVNDESCGAAAGAVVGNSQSPSPRNSDRDDESALDGPMIITKAPSFPDMSSDSDDDDGVMDLQDITRTASFSDRSSDTEDGPGFADAAHSVTRDGDGSSSSDEDDTASGLGHADDQASSESDDGRNIVENKRISAGLCLNDDKNSDGLDGSLQCPEGLEEMYMKLKADEMLRRRVELEQLVKDLQYKLQIETEVSEENGKRLSHLGKELGAAHSVIDSAKEKEREAKSKLEGALQSKETLTHKLQEMQLEVAKAQTTGAVREQLETELRQARQELLKAQAERDAASVELEKAMAERDRYCEDCKNLQEEFPKYERRVLENIISAAAKIQQPTASPRGGVSSTA